jgi:acyl-CoA synthetase (AMP-forming)/AMP-acid ligase II
MNTMPTFCRAPLAIPHENASAFLGERAKISPDRIAVTFQGENITFAGLWARVQQARRYLQQLGVTAPDKLGLSLGNTPNFVVWACAGLADGAVIVPIYDTAPGPEFTAKCRLAGANAVVASDDRVVAREAQLSAGGVPTSVIPESAWTETAPDYELTQRVPESACTDEAAFLPFSSGSTGDPKAVLLTHANIVASRMLFAAATRMGPLTTLVHFIPLAHVYGWMAVTAAWAAGGKVVMHARYDFARLLADIEAHRATAVFGVPQTILDFANAPEGTSERLRTLRFINTGSAPLAAEVIRGVAERFGVPVTSGYGLTEAAPVSHDCVDRKELIDARAVGFAVANTQVRLIDPEDPDRPILQRKTGELVVQGPQVAPGYLRNGALERSAWLSDGAFRTGDLAEFDDIGRIRIVGRLKNIIKYKGYSLSPPELEALLGCHPDVQDCAVVGRPDPVAGEIPTAFVVLRAGAPVSKRDILGFVRARIAPQKRIRDVVFVAQIPRSSAGKVLTKELVLRSEA